ncbi:MAG: ribulose-phosphate 3-epimerase [Coriobacteriaceae bacterium]|jgi:ribulose-phosphate 3-epimerase|nr:ribulose-phosphate 3-epimerase [Coriobacteriaceae bacterium]
MFGKVRISPSILSADFMNMERSVRMIEEGGADFIHVDVMDGHFVPNLTLGVPFVAQLKRITALPLDVHLMVSNPLVQIPWYLEAGADYLTFHIEAFDAPANKPPGQAEKIAEAIDLIRAAGAHPGASLKPDTPVSRLEPYVKSLDLVLVMSVYPGFSGQAYIEGSHERVAAVARMAQAAGASPLIEVDGGIGVATAGKVGAAGADVLVAGNAVFAASDPGKAIKAIAQAAQAAQAARSSADVRQGATADAQAASNTRVGAASEHQAAQAARSPADIRQGATADAQAAPAPNTQPTDGAMS